MSRRPLLYSLLLPAMALCPGCGGIFAPQPAPLFTTPLTIEGTNVGPAIIDTGGAYEVILREPFGLEVIGNIEVLAFGGVEQVDVTRGFEYTAGGISAQAETALVGISSCDCNGVGIRFFRKYGTDLMIDFTTLSSAFGQQPPDGAIRIPFHLPPGNLPNFDSSFIEVEVKAGGQSRTLIGLLDTGTNSTLMRRDLFPDVPRADTRSYVQVAITNELLGTVDAVVGLFSTPGPPDIILGTDVMRAWGNRWYFTYYDAGGYTAVVPAAGDIAAPSPPTLLKSLAATPPVAP